VVPNRLRDLEGHALLGYHLERHGHQVQYSTGVNLLEELMVRAPDVVVLDQLAWDYRVSQARLAKRLGMKLVVLPTSGLFQDQDRDAHAQIAGKLHKVSNLIDLYLTWGEGVRSALLSEGLLTEEQVFATGSPRFDLYHPRFTAMVENREKFLGRLGINRVAAPLLVWTPNNTSFAHFDRKSLERWKAATRLPEEEFLAEMEDVLTQYREHSRVVLELAKRHEDWNFVVKVHPGDKVESYQFMKEAAGNIHVVKEVSIRDLLHHSAALLQRYSTTANEAWMLDKPVLLLEIGSHRIQLREQYTAGSHVVRSIEEVDGVVSAYVDGAPVPADQRAARGPFLAECYHHLDGKASERCASLIHFLLCSGTDDAQRKVREAAAQALADWRKQEASRWSNRLKRLVGLPPEASLRFWKRVKPAPDPTPALEASARRLHGLYRAVLARERELAIAA
jgi:surface carbohydrate biosynthesis protein